MDKVFTRTQLHLASSLIKKKKLVSSNALFVYVRGISLLFTTRTINQERSKKAYTGAVLVASGILLLCG